MHDIITEKDINHFFSYVEKTDFCWNWSGGTIDGYGCFNLPLDRFGVGYKLAHRFAWIIYYGIEPKLHVLHTCDNPRCVKKEHLFLGTNADNMIDKANKCRASKGLNPDSVIKIFLSNKSYSEIAKEFSISTTSVFKIKHKKVWKIILNNLGR